MRDRRFNIEVRLTTYLAGSNVGERRTIDITHPAIDRISDLEHIFADLVRIARALDSETADGGMH